MGDALLVHVADSGEHLAEGLGSVWLSDAVLGVCGQEVEEVAAAAQLRYDEELVGDAEDVVKLDDEGVPAQLLRKQAKGGVER